VLTKPLGTGIYSTALKMGALSASGEKVFYEVMSALNRFASDGALAHGANACTDVTGFGLIGHALEMAEASEVTIVIDAPALPLLPGVLEHAAAGYLTGGGMANREFAKDKVRLEGGISSEMEMLVYDAQTSGGLLVSLPAAESERFLESVREKGVRDAAVVGEVVPPGDSKIIVRG
jgi:selenide,water dikinase